MTYDVENSGPDLGQEQKYTGLNRFIGSQQYIWKAKQTEMKRFSLILIYVYRIKLCRWIRQVHLYTVLLNLHIPCNMI